MARFHRIMYTFEGVGMCGVILFILSLCFSIDAFIYWMIVFYLAIDDERSLLRPCCAHQLAIQKGRII